MRWPDGHVSLDRSTLEPVTVWFYPFFGEGAPTKIDYRKKEDLV